MSSPTVDVAALEALIGRRITVAGHFVGPVTLDGVEDLGDVVVLRIRTPEGTLDETTIELSELADGTVIAEEEGTRLVDGGELFDLVESRRIELAYAHDPNFAVSLSGVRGLPHQIVAVYKHMLPQPRLRFVLADDPGAGKTIMAGLLLKELRLRMVADRVLILCPAPLTIQWQDELYDKFDERFTIVDSHQVRWQLGQLPWFEHDRCISSIDFAKRDEVLPDLLRADWDLVVIDEAHKCSAASRWDAVEQREKLDRTKRYTLGEELSRRSERLLLMTATPHSGDTTRFHNFLRLLDPDQFAIDELAAEQIAAEDSPYFLRREKEMLKDEHGHDLFVPREVLTQPFELGPGELALYEAVTEYIQDFLGAAPGRRGNAIALARTVLQRRLASSLGAIRSSLEKRSARISERLEELEALPADERAKRLRELRLAEPLDPEQETDDATEDEEEAAIEGVVVAETLEGMRVEIKALERLLRRADGLIATGESEAKLDALRECLQNAELAELSDGRGKLLIFTEHRDTLNYLERNLQAWGYTTCTIHGGLPPVERKRVQQLFHQERQVCIATEAAGEGINLQFCHLMVNYDLPWNPIRLEQRMGRIHRIGQTRKCVIFNFCATNTIEGKPLRRLLEKLEQMRQDLGGRVYDVVGHVLAHGGLDFERLLRDALLKAVPIDAAEREIAAIDPKAYKAYEEAIGIAQATKHIDMSWVRQRDWRSEERRLMPEFVEQLFSRAADRDGMRVEPRKDGEHLLRIEHVPRALRDDRLQAVKRLGPPQDHYLKATFRKEVRERAEHEDAVLLSPGSRFRIAGRRSRSACGAKSDEVRSCSTSGRPPTRPPRPARPRPALAPRGRALPPGRGSGRAAHPWSRRADDVREYGRRWVERTWERVGHLYPRIREVQGEQLGLEHDASTERAAGRPIAYLWTRTVPCPNTASGAHELPLVRQTWLAKKSGRYIALRPRVDRAARTVSWEVVEATDAAGLGFDPAGFSSRGRASCMICGAAVDAGYLKEQGLADRMGITPLAAVVVKPSGRGRDYLPAGSYPEPLAEECEAVLAGLDVEPPEEPLPRITRMTGGICTVYGLIRYRQLFTPRQLATLCAFAHGVRETHAAMVAEGMEPQRARAVCAYMGLIVDRLADYHTTLCRWESGVQKMQNTFARQALPMVWDFAENNPFGGASGDARRYVEFNADIVNDLAAVREPAKVVRTSATQLPDRDNYFDAVITDPPYYDNISYADLSDFFYVWLKRSVGFLFEEHVAGELTPKQREVVAVKYRHGNDMAVARVFYEREMAAAFAEAHRVLKPEAPLVCVYAHRTTLGWASLVEALRIARFTITEAWPLDTEMPERSIGQGRASLASSIFLVARRRDSDATGAYHDVLAELDRMIGERLERLTAAGVAGSDLVIAAIGAGLAPFTRYAAVELPSGEPVAAERFLEEVQSRVLGSILSGLGSVDPATRYYVLSRYLFGSADIEFDEANNLARSAGVELSDGLGHGPLRLADIKGKTVHLRDFTERGEEPELGQDGGPLIDVLHGLLWRASHASHEIPSYLDAARPDPEQLRQVAQVLQGKALREEGESKATEAQACERLLGAWSRLVEDNLLRSRT